MSQVATRALAVGVGVLAAGLVISPTLAAGASPATAEQPTSLTLKAAHTTVAPKHKDTLTTTLKVGAKRLAGETLYVEYRAAGAHKWSAPITVKPKTNARGEVSFVVAPGSKKGERSQFEVLFKGTAKYRPSHSSIVTIAVA